MDMRSGELRKRGVRVPLQQQPFRILVRLAERPGEIVTREAIRQELWPADTYVDFEQGINAAVKRLREALEGTLQRPLGSSRHYRSPATGSSHPSTPRVLRLPRPATIKQTNTEGCAGDFLHARKSAAGPGSEEGMRQGRPNGS
jgi:hypothetical protein